ncbi:MAG: HNH endonuclease signature motif containing protein [Gammaproteobacteria bacterium]|nr:HNH endonuclease signature motif containing protein [Gammaproteobacteria bacterium]
MDNVIHYSEYGNRKSKFGWEIHHIVSPKDGGSHKLHNLQPLQWEANVKKGQP